MMMDDPTWIFSGIGSLIAVVLYVGSILWSLGDAQRRGKSGCLVALVVAILFWPIGLIVGLVALVFAIGTAFRKKTGDDLPGWTS